MRRFSGSAVRSCRASRDACDSRGSWPTLELGIMTGIALRRTFDIRRSCRRCRRLPGFARISGSSRRRSCYGRIVPTFARRIPRRIAYHARRTNRDRTRHAPPGAGLPLRLGGVDIPHDHGLVGHSDADVLLHAVTDALLGRRGAWATSASCFPTPTRRTAAAIRPTCCGWPCERVAAAGYRVVNLDCIVFAQRPKLSPYKDAIRQRIAELLEVAAGLRRREGQDRRTRRPGRPARSDHGRVRRAAGTAVLDVETQRDSEHCRHCQDRTREHRMPPTKRPPPIYAFAFTTRSRRTKSRSRRSQPGKVGIYLCGPTVYKPSHIGHMVGPVIFDAIKRYLAYSGYDVTLGRQHHRRRRQADRRGEQARHDDGRRRRRDDGRLPPQPRGAGRRHDRPLPEGDRAHRRDHRLHAEADRQGLRLRLRRRRATSTSAKDRDYGKLSGRSLEAMQGEGGGAADRKRIAGRLRLVERRQAGRAVVGQPLGQGPARLAHRVLGHEPASFSARRSTFTAAGSTWCSRITRTKSPRANAATASRSRSTGCTTA